MRLATDAGDVPGDAEGVVGPGVRVQALRGVAWEGGLNQGTMGQFCGIGAVSSFCGKVGQIGVNFGARRLGNTGNTESRAGIWE